MSTHGPVDPTKKLTPDDALQTLWDERNVGIGRAGVLAIVVTAVGTLVSGVGGTLVVKYNSVDAAVASAKNDLAQGIGLPPIGSVCVWPAKVPVPDRWLVCNGDAIDVDPKSEIARVLDTTYGAAGPGKVKLPDFRGYFLRGADGRTPADGGQDPDGPRSPGSSQADAFQDHRHVVSGLTDETKSLPQGHDRVFRPGGEQFPTTGVDTRDTQRKDFGARASTETRPENYAVHWIIRVK